MNERLTDEDMAEMNAEVERMEEIFSRWAEKNLQLNEFLQENVRYGWGENVIDVAMREILRLKQENNRLKTQLDELKKIAENIENDRDETWLEYREFAESFDEVKCDCSAWSEHHRKHCPTCDGKGSYFIKYGGGNG